MLARHLMMGLGLVMFLLPGWLRADDTEDKAVKTIQRLGAVFRCSNTLPGSPVVLVEFHNTKVTDADLKEIAALKQLQRVGLNATKVTDAGLKELAPLTQLKELYLSWTNVTDEGVKELAPFTQLEKLWLDSTKVTDPGLKELASLKQLKSLRIMTTPVTTEGVQELQKALPQCHIHWESEILSNVVADGCVRRRWFAPPHRQTVPRRSPSLTTASRSAPAISSLPIPSA